MTRVDGTSARQLDLLAPDEPLGRRDIGAVRPPVRRPLPAANRPGLRLLRRDVYAELARRRRRAQIAARHEVESGQ